MMVDGYAVQPAFSGLPTDTATDRPFSLHSRLSPPGWRPRWRGRGEAPGVYPGAVGYQLGALFKANARGDPTLDERFIFRIGELDALLDHGNLTQVASAFGLGS